MTLQLFQWGRKMSGHVPSHNVRLLDAGCGFGGSTRQIANLLNNTIVEAKGITLSDSQVRRARELTSNGTTIDFLRMDVTDMTFDDNYFDIVWSLEMEPHVDDKHKMLKEMLRVLKPGGLLVLGCWNVKSEV